MSNCGLVGNKLGRGEISTTLLDLIGSLTKMKILDLSRNDLRYTEADHFGFIDRLY